MAVTIRKPYAVRQRVSIDCGALNELGEVEFGRTEQHHKDNCEIDNILRKYDKTGLITHVNRATAEYGDFTLVNEYQESLNTVINAENAFMELPAHVRKKFGNDAGAFFEYATDPANKDGMVELGLATPPEVISDPAPVIEETPPV